ncbi:MAG: hypothetical protein H6810_11435 [Phycisphaeraceae bacterium]|nr:MAG: hypothetical protein H6810_11435 [Phycisphaeraceae bacterium]
MPGRIDHRTGAMLILAFGAPTLMVGLIRYVPLGPQTASASPGSSLEAIPTMLPMTDAAMVAYTDAQRAMIRAADAIEAAEAPISPFRVTDREEKIKQAVEPTGFDAVLTKIEPPTFRLTAIVAGRRTVAIIDGTACTVGADLGRGWTIASIDSDAQSVVLHNEAYGDHTLFLRKP